jgi:hypothetical protein
MVNTEPIKPNLNGVFANKYGKTQCWPRNYDNLWEFSNSLILVLHQFANIYLYSAKFKNLRVYQYLDLTCWINGE